jgi:DNA-binding transcriptional MerR regulator
MTATTFHVMDLGIRAVSARTGLSVDTLRWYEREGLLPAVPRGPDGRRAYPERLVVFIELIVALRRTGLSVSDTRAFVEMAGEGAASHGRRMALLERQREAIRECRRQIDADLGAVETKISHYRELIDSGRDCDGVPVDTATAQMQPRSA